MARTHYSEIEGRSGAYLALLGVLGALILGGLGATWYMEHNGHYVTGMSNRIVWGTPHVFAIFLIVAASGVLNVASITSVFGREPLQAARAALRPARRDAARRRARGAGARPRAPRAADRGDDALQLQVDLRLEHLPLHRRKGHASRPMVPIAPGGGATSMAMPMTCNMHHSGLGSRGGLWVSPAPTLPSYPASELSYRKHIYPILRSKCSPCHIPGSTKTRLVTKSDLETPSTSIDYSSGLDLMTYGGSNVSGVSKLGVASVVKPTDPEQSLLLRKTLFGAVHGGGAFWNQGDPDYLALKQWIAEGALTN